MGAALPDEKGVKLNNRAQLGAGLIERIELQGDIDRLRLATDGTLFADDGNTHAPVSEHEAS